MAATYSPTRAEVSVAVGLSSGMVYVLTGDMSGERGSKALLSATCAVLCGAAKLSSRFPPLPAAKGKLQHVAKLSARPDSGNRWCVMGVAWHVPSSAMGARGVAAEGGAAPMMQSLFVVTESQTLSFNVQTGLKVGGVIE